MAGFGRSNSLSINTSGSLFGNNTSQGQQSAGLFGSSTNASQPQSTGGLFGSTPQPQTGGLFGGTSAASTSQPPQSGSLFGGQAPSSQAQSAGLFGNLNKPAAPAVTSGGLFGSSATQAQPQQAGSQFGGALGVTTTNQAQGTSQSGGLFGGLGQPQKPSLFGSSTQQTTTPSLFGNMATQQPQKPTPSLFSSTQNIPIQTQNSLFGGMNTQNKTFLGSHTVTGGSNLGASAQAVQMQALDSIKGTTRFSDLHPDIQNQIQEIDMMIQKRISACHQIREILPGHGNEVATLGPDVAYIENFLSTVELGLDNDSHNIAILKDLVKKDADDAMLSFRAITNLQLPAQFRYGNPTNLSASSGKPTPSASLDDEDPNKPVDLIGYFTRRADDLDRTLDKYQTQIREIEAHLRTMEAGTVEKAQQLAGSRSAPRDQRRELVEALKAIEGAILDSAKKVGQVRDAVTKETLGSVGATLL